MCNQGLERRFPLQNSDADDDLPSAMEILPSDEPPRVKLLCSFGGSVIPRPHDGKLRYVGGDTRILSLARDVGYEELMLRMKEIFEGVTALKYQQPDEDLDALVSVVNDDDVTNMMEEYDKLGADGLNKLRIFLFSGFENDFISFEIDERESERRYVDALNSLGDSSAGDTAVALPPDQFMPPPALPPINLHFVNAPHPSTGSGIYPQGHTPVDMTLPWSPAYISSGHHTPREARADFPGSPSSCCCVGLGDTVEKVTERVNHQPNYGDNVVCLPNVVVANASNKAGYQNNAASSYSNGNFNHNAYEGNYSCDNCRTAVSRQTDMRWRPGQHHLEQPGSFNEFAHNPSRGADCIQGRDGFLLTSENENQQFCNDLPPYERGWTAHPHQSEDPRAFVSGVGRLREHYIDSNGRSYILDSPSNTNCFLHNDCRQNQPSNDLTHERIVEQTIMNGSHLHNYEPTAGNVLLPVQVAGTEDCGLRYGNIPANYSESHYRVPQGSNFVNTYRKKVHSPVHGGPSCEAMSVNSQTEGQLQPGTLRVFQEGGPTMVSLTQDSQKMFDYDASSISTPSAQVHEPYDQFYISSDKLGVAVSREASASNRDDISSFTRCQVGFKHGFESLEQVSSFSENKVFNGNYEDKHVEKLDNMNILDVQKNHTIHEKIFDSNGETCPDDGLSVPLSGQFDANSPIKEEKLSVQNLSFLPDLIASVKKAALEDVNDMKIKAQGDDCLSESMKKSLHQFEFVNEEVGEAEESLEDNAKISKIEPTKAEAEAVARGLQTIKNDDLEEIRELGSGTYGAVFHGKWKGSDVAIKRIKASCFSGRPSERDRLIADFWKEALLLSSLHHPNVVSFYGIVRDGPDGSLATVTEFMVNGSLKQFLQKKDRTIDRRKRLIISMDAAFGMEYLHGKSIVHFDLKCENLLVNMRDPQRPVCKIGDLGLSKVRQHTLVSGGVRGTLPWMAPELLSGKSNMVTEKIDVYSFGVVMWELLTGDEPYADMRCAAIIGGIVNNTLRPEIPRWCDPEWRSLMESCWASDPAGRPSFAEISQKLRKMAAAMNVK